VKFGASRANRRFQFEKPVSLSSARAMKRAFRRRGVRQQ